MISDTIRRVNGYEKDAYTYYPVIIVGAGASGIATACQLKQQLSFDQFRVFERQAGIGGTWWINRYPGVAWCVPIVLGFL
jgi:cation diffusion facilitator CzcD-associated flavoprotein CzcO